MAVIPFYGGKRPDLFAIERRTMDRPGHVVSALDGALPDGLVLDVGAGNGFTAERLSSPRRRVLPLEPSKEMVGPNRELPWVRGDAEHLPFRIGSFDAAYATWAYFFSRDWDPSRGVAELHRVVKPGGALLIVDNLGEDEFTGLAPTEITADPAYWRRVGFVCRAIDTRFEFADVDEARMLLSFYFGDAGRRWERADVSFRVGLFSSVSRGLVPDVADRTRN